MTTPTLEKPRTAAQPFMLGTSGGELVATVQPERERAAAAQRLDSTLASIDRFEQAVQRADAQRLKATTNPIQRFIYHYEVPVVWGCLAAGFAIAGFGVFADTIRGASAFLCLVGGGAVIACAPWAISYAEKKRQTDKGYATTNIGEITAALGAMSAGERAALGPHFESWRARTIDAGHLTPDARDVLNATLGNVADALAQQRTGRLAVLVRDLESDDAKRQHGFESRLAPLLDEYPVNERRAVAEVLRQRLFDGEHCRLKKLPAAAIHTLHDILKQAREATSS